MTYCVVHEQPDGTWRYRVLGNDGEPEGEWSEAFATANDAERAAWQLPMAVVVKDLATQRSDERAAQDLNARRRRPGPANR